MLVLVFRILKVDSSFQHFTIAVHKEISCYVIRCLDRLVGLTLLVIGLYGRIRVKELQGYLMRSSGLHYEAVNGLRYLPR